MKRTTQLLKKRYSSNLVRQFLLSSLVVFITILLISSSSITADDDDEGDDDDEDLSRDLGWASVSLFVVSSIYIGFYQIYRVTRFLTKEGNQGEIRKAIMNVFLKVRKPLLYIHYFAGLAALIVILIHGIILTNDNTYSKIGWATAGVYLFYILTGILLWFKIISPKRNLKFRKAVLWIHRSLLLFAIVIAIHIIHLTIAD